jgi:hypothetical protein
MESTMKNQFAITTYTTYFYNTNNNNNNNNNNNGTNPDPTLDKVSNTISLVFISISFLCTFFVVLNLMYKSRRKRNKFHSSSQLSTTSSETEPLYNRDRQANLQLDAGHSTSEQKQFTDLTQYAIFCMILSDLLMETLYFPTNLIRLINTFAPSDKNMLYAWTSSINMERVSVFTAEITEMFVIGSGIWSLFIAISIYQTVRSINEHHETILNPSQLSDDDDDDESEYDESSYNENNAIVYTNEPAIAKSAGSKSKRKRNSRLFHLVAYKSVINTKIAYAIIAWGIPFVLCSVCVGLEEKFLFDPKSTGKELYLVNVIPDIVKTLLYAALEIYTVIVRIKIFKCTQKMLSDISALLSTSPNAIRKRQEERRLFRQLSFYSLPFILFGIWLILYRSYVDIWFTVKVIQHGFHKFTGQTDEAGRVLMAMHHMLSPLRGLMNAIVYVFRKQIRKMDYSSCC